MELLPPTNIAESCAWYSAYEYLGLKLNRINSVDYYEQYVQAEADKVVSEDDMEIDEDVIIDYAYQRTIESVIKKLN